MSSTSNPSSAARQPYVGGILRLHLDQLQRGDNVRGLLPDLEELGESLRAVGQQQLITVEPLDGDRYSVFDGNRRFEAAKLVNLPHLDAVIRRVDGDVDRIVRQIAIGTTGRHLDPIDEAHAIATLMFEHKLTREEIAGRFRRAPNWVKDRLSLLQLDEDEQRDVRSGTLPVRQAVLLVTNRRNGALGGPPAGRVNVSRTTPIVHQPTERRRPAKDPMLDLHERHFVRAHPLGDLAVERCAGLVSHRGRVFVGGMACGECWEAVIRADEAAKVRAGGQV